MRISTRCQYAIQVSLLLTRAEGAVTTAEMHQKLGISVSYLEQLLAVLRQKEIVASIRGPGGGYLLARHPDSISAGEIIQAFQNESQKSSDTKADELSLMWQQFCRETWQYLSRRTLGQMTSQGSVVRMPG
ncbi:Rrf2 family transcriptional regulator [Enterobacter cloacae]|uniref:RrF2 family transcriptional regulator n=1 Tax=Enterobacter cloacae TaxID=550 RepID=UPI0032DB0DE4